MQRNGSMFSYKKYSCFFIFSGCVKEDIYVLGNMPFSFSVFKDYGILWGDSGIIRFVEIL